MPDQRATSDDILQQEFNRWAEAGEGEKMEHHHLDITGKTIRLMDLRPGDRVLDLGCGSGWATRLLARLVTDGPEGFGQVVGVDVSDEMIRQARAAPHGRRGVAQVQHARAGHRRRMRRRGSRHDGQPMRLRL